MIFGKETVLRYVSSRIVEDGSDRKVWVCEFTGGCSALHAAMERLRADRPSDPDSVTYSIRVQYGEDRGERGEFVLHFVEVLRPNQRGQYVDWVELYANPTYLQNLGIQDVPTGYMGASGAKSFFNNVLEAIQAAPIGRTEHRLMPACTS